MTFVFQKILNDDPSGLPGDCLRACVVNVSGLDYDAVPHFVTSDDWWLSLLGFAFKNDAEIFYIDQSRWNYFPTPDAELYIAIGQSPRGERKHAVLVDKDLNLVHDPYPSGNGVKEIDYCLEWRSGR